MTLNHLRIEVLRKSKEIERTFSQNPNPSCNIGILVKLQFIAGLSFMTNATKDHQLGNLYNF